MFFNRICILLFLSTSVITHTHEYLLGVVVDKYRVMAGLFSTQDAMFVDIREQSIDTIGDFNECMVGLHASLSQQYNISIKCACIAVSGNTQPSKDYIQSPHLSFPIDGALIGALCDMETVFVINDFEIIGYGLKNGGNHYCFAINDGVSQDKAPRLILGAGAGLGSSLLVWNELAEQYEVLPLGACFTDFVPMNEEELAFADFIRNKNGLASWGYILGSKGGLCAVYEYITGQSGDYTHPQAIFDNRFADEACKQAVDFYMTLYTRLIRNAILFVQPYGGVYLVDNVVLQNQMLFQDAEFLAALLDCHNDTLKSILVQVPLYGLVEPAIELYGTINYLMQTLVEVNDL